MSPRDGGVSGPWLVRPAPVPDAAWKLYCFPWSGAGAGVYRDWQALMDPALMDRPLRDPARIDPALRDPARMGPAIEIVAVAYPGRERRITEPLVGSVAELADGVLPALLADVDRPFALFGHSLGALVAHAVAARLAGLGAGPAHVFVSGSAPPGTTSSPFTHTLPDAEFLAELTALQDSQDEVLSDPEVAAILLPTLRADIRAAELWSLTTGPKLSCPVTAFAAARDRMSPPEELRLWEPFAPAGFSCLELDGDHMFVTGPEARKITGHIARTLLAGRC
jgi:surfactin synthase thioesterase subunit